MTQSSPPRVGTTSLALSEGAWDAGVHAELDVGAIELGLATSPSALGLTLDAPRVGHLRLAFDLGPDGTTRLVSLARRGEGGEEYPVVLTDETETLRLKGELEKLKLALRQGREELEERFSEVATQRDEARDQVLALEGAVRDAQIRLEAQDQHHSLTIRELADEATRARDELQQEKDQAQALQADREAARAELDRVRNELDAGSTTLMRELTDARAARDAAEALRLKVSDELTQVAEALALRHRELEAVKAAVKELTRQLEAAEHARADVEASLARQVGDVTHATTEADELRARVAEARAAADAARTENEALRTAHAAALSAVRAQQDAATQAAAEEARAMFAHAKAARAEAEARLAELDERAATAHTELLSLQAEREGLQGRVEELETARSAAEADRERLKDELDDAAHTLERELTALRDEASHELKATQARHARELAEARVTRPVPTAEGAPDLQRLQEQHAREIASLQAHLAQAQADSTTALAQLQESHAIVGEWQAQLEAQHGATEEARGVARQLHARVEKLTSEREEARNIARTLHQRLAAMGGDTSVPPLAARKP